MIKKTVAIIAATWVAIVFLGAACRVISDAFMLGWNLL